MRFLSQLALIFIATALILGLFSCFSPRETPRDLIFYYFESCPSCDEYKLAEDYSEMIIKLNKKNKWNGKHFNLITPEAADQLKKTLNEKSLPDISRSLPLLIIDSEYINGYEAIGEKLEKLLTE